MFTCDTQGGVSFILFDDGQQRAAETRRNYTMNSVAKVMKNAGLVSIVISDNVIT